MAWASGACATHGAVEGVLPEQSLEMQVRFQSPGLCTPPLLHILREEELFYWLFPSHSIHAKAETQRG